jgi:hypothetical protein
MQSDALARLMAAPEPVAATEMKTFSLENAEGKIEDWEFTIRTGAARQAELFYSLVSASSTAVIECQKDVKGRVAGVHFYPTPESDIHITDGGYLASLYVLAAVVVEPAFSLDQLALLGHKYGNSFDAVMDWASSANGVTQYLVDKYLAASKNAPGAPVGRGKRKS